MQPSSMHTYRCQSCNYSINLKTFEVRMIEIATSITYLVHWGFENWTASSLLSTVKWKTRMAFSMINRTPSYDGHRRPKMDIQEFFCFHLHNCQPSNSERKDRLITLVTNVIIVTTSHECHKETLILKTWIEYSTPFWLRICHPYLLIKRKK